MFRRRQSEGYFGLGVNTPVALPSPAPSPLPFPSLLPPPEPPDPGVPSSPSPLPSPDAGGSFTLRPSAGAEWRWRGSSGGESRIGAVCSDEPTAKTSKGTVGVGSSSVTGSRVVSSGVNRP